MTDLLRGAGGVLAALGCGLPALLLYLQGGAILAFVYALGTVRVRRRPAAVRITGADPWPMTCAGFGLWLVPVAFSVVGLGSPWLGVAAAVGLWFGFRVEVRVTAAGTRVVRRFAFVVPWCWRRHPGRPHAFVDGWGDFMDPEALHIGFPAARRTLELGWSHKGSGHRAEDLAGAINAAVAALEAR